VKKQHNRERLVSGNSRGNENANIAAASKVERLDGHKPEVVAFKPAVRYFQCSEMTHD
jgi:hypothetical protein